LSTTVRGTVIVNVPVAACACAASGGAGRSGVVFDTALEHAASAAAVITDKTSVRGFIVDPGRPPARRKLSDGA
jgi:hypothetical protein